MDKHINMLNAQNDNDMGHFAWIKNLFYLVTLQLTREPREIENSDFDETLHTCRGGG